MGDGGVFVIFFIEGRCGGTWRECGESASGVGYGDGMCVGVEGIDEAVELRGELRDID